MELSNSCPSKMQHLYNFNVLQEECFFFDFVCVCVQILRLVPKGSYSYRNIVKL